MTTDELRAKFEAWARDVGFKEFAKRSDGEYATFISRTMFDACQFGHASRDAEVEALRMDAERIDALENWCIEGCVDIGIELEGGVYLRLAAIGESDVDYREKNTVREAIDAAREKQP